MFIVQLVFLAQELGLTKNLEALFLFAGFGSSLILINLALAQIRFSRFVRQLVIVCLVSAMISSVLWLNPFFKSISGEYEHFENSVNFVVNLNPAVVILDNIYDFHIFRSGHLYTQLGSSGLSIIGDYYTLIKYWGGGIFFGFFYFFIGFIFYGFVSLMKFVSAKLRDSSSKSPSE